MVYSIGATLQLVCSLPFKIIQRFFYNTPLYKFLHIGASYNTEEETEIPVAKKISPKQQYINKLTNMTENDLTEELNKVIKTEEYEKAAIIHTVLQRYQPVKK